MRCSLLVLALLILTGIAVAEVQPTAEDWKSLLDTTVAIRNSYSQLVKRVKPDLEWLKKHPDENRFSAENRHGAKTIAQLEGIIQRGEKTIKELDTAIVEMKGMKTTGDTRARFLALRRQTKRAGYQMQQDREYAYADRYVFGSLRLPDNARTAEPPLPIAPLPKQLAFTWQTFPRLDGSTTAQPLAALIACRFLGLGAEWRVRAINDYRNADGTRERILVPVCGEPSAGEAAGTTPGLSLSMVLSGTPTAYTRLIHGQSSIIIVARPPSPDELALAKKQGVAFELRPIAADAFVFIVNGRNPITGLTVKQLQAIYQDDVIRWSEVGGEEKNVVAYQRERNSGSQEMMESLVMKGLSMAAPGEQMIGYGMGGPYNQLEHNPAGLGYTFFYYHTVQSPATPAFHVVQMSMDGKKTEPPAPTLKMLAINGVRPTPATIADGSYPYVTPVYAVVRTDSKPDSAAVRLRDWLLTPEGQALVKESGYVPVARK